MKVQTIYSMTKLSSISLLILSLCSTSSGAATKPTLSMSNISCKRAMKKNSMPAAELFSSYPKEHLFSEIKYYSHEISKACRSKDCIVLGIGRSPAPFVKYLQLQNKIEAKELPLSVSGSLRGANISGGAPVPPLTAEIINYFDQVIPKGFTEYILVDAIVEGVSLLVVSEWLNKYFEVRKISPQTKVKPLALVELPEDAVDFLALSKSLGLSLTTKNLVLAKDATSHFSQDLWSALKHKEFGSSYSSFDISSEVSPSFNRNSGDVKAFESWLGDQVNQEPY